MQLIRAQSQNVLQVEIGSLYPITFAAATVLLTLVAAAACHVPARRAIRVTPMTALSS